MNYNGYYDMFLDIIVTSDTHDKCLFIFNRFKSLIKAFNFGNIRIRELKSARKGDVLSREIQINIIGLADDIIIFRECIDFIIQKCNILSGKNCVRIARTITTRKDARMNLIKETV